jgi:hypothetical protein
LCKWIERAAGKPTIEIIPPPAVLAVGFTLAVMIVVAAREVRSSAEGRTRRKEE